MKFKWTCKVMIGIFLISAFAVNGYADSYDYHPSSHLHLGGGYNPYRPHEAFLDCIDHDGEEEVIVGPDGAFFTEARITVVKDRRQFYNAVDFPASIDGGFLFTSGQIYAQEPEGAFQSDSLSWLITFKSDYSHVKLKNPRLKDGLQNLNQTELYNRCGSEIVIQQNKGVLAYALFTVRNLNQTQKRSLETQLSENVSSDLFNPSSAAHYKSFMSSLLTEPQGDVVVNVRGRDGCQTLGGFIGQNRPNTDLFELFNNAYTALADCVRGMDLNQAVPIQFDSVSLSQFARKMERRFQDFKTHQVSELYNWYMDLFGTVNRLRKTIQGVRGGEYVLSNEELRVMQEHLQAYSNAVNEVYTAGTKCFDEGAQHECVIPASVSTLSSITWPNKMAADDDICQKLRTYVWNKGLFTNSQMLEMAERSNFVPFIQIDENRNEHIEGWYSCDQLLNWSFIK